MFKHVVNTRNIHIDRFLKLEKIKPKSVIEQIRTKYLKRFKLYYKNFEAIDLEKYRQSSEAILHYLNLLDERFEVAVHHHKDKHVELSFYKLPFNYEIDFTYFKSGKLFLGLFENGLYYRDLNTLDHHLIVVRDYTIKDYRSALEQHIYPLFRKKYIHDISILEIENLKNNLLMKYASTRVKNIFIPFKGAFREAVRFSYISDNPFNKVEAIRKKKNENKKLRPFSKDEINFLIENATGSLKFFIALSFYLGTRPSELLALKWGDIHLKEQYVNITGAITGKQSEEEIDLTKSLSSRRQIYFPLIALKYFEFNNHDYIFVSQKNEPFTTTKSMSEKFRKLLKKTNLENHVLYDLRHSYASINLSENTMPIILISKQMGHKDSTVTLSVYADYIKNNVEETINIIDCAFRD